MTVPPTTESSSTPKPLEVPAPPTDEPPPAEHWGKELNRLMDEIGPIEMLYPEIEDPVEWVKHLRAEERIHHISHIIWPLTLCETDAPPPL